MPRTTIAILILTGMTSSALLGAAISQSEADQLAEQIMSTDEKVHSQAVEKIKNYMQTSPGLAAPYLATRWAGRLLAKKHTTEVADWTQQATCSAPGVPLDAKIWERLQRYRIRALLDAHRNDEALSAAKSYYNLVRFDGMDKANELFVECLQAAGAEDKQIVERFKSEQTKGAVATTQPADRSGTVIGSIAVEPKPYVKALARGKTNYGSLMRRGNLLLLADKGAEAQEIFEKAYQLAGEEKLVEATESIARAIRAQDGCTGRAIQFLKSVAPKEEPQSASTTRPS